MHTTPPLWFLISESLTEGSRQVSVTSLFLTNKWISCTFVSGQRTLKYKQCKPLEARSLKESSYLRKIHLGHLVEIAPEFSSSPRKAADSIDWSSVHCPTEGSTLSIFTQCWAFASDGGATTLSTFHLPALVSESLFSRCLTPPLLPLSLVCPVWTWPCWCGLTMSSISSSPGGE